MKKLICFILILSFLLSLVGCKSANSSINGFKLKDFTIVYSEEDNEYAKRAAEYIQDQIKEKTGLNLPVIEDSAAAPTANEIVVGNTDRAISKKLDQERDGLEFSILYDSGSVALEADYFIIAAAAYFFIANYVPEGNFAAIIPEEAKIHTPIIKEAKNFIMLIGDGMGLYQTKMFEYMENNVEFGMGEDIFFGYYLPYMGYSRTDSLSGTTDSAAGGTALASGTKTINEYIGRDKDLNDLKNLCELAGEKGMSAGVMSTENKTGATPASFSAHADSRGGLSAILNSQSEAKRGYGLVLECNFDYRNVKKMGEHDKKVDYVLETLSANEKGFFMMYEEAYIDKHCHNNNMESAFMAMVRFNHAIGKFMEFAFYNPETFVLITADHETGDLYPEEDGTLKYHHDDHTSANVPIFTYGYGAELFDGVEIENIQIAHTIASFMGVYDFGDQSEYQYLRK